MRTYSPITSRRGILVGRPLAAAMMLAWLLALAGFIHLLNMNRQLTDLILVQKNQLLKQQDQIAGLQDRLHVLEAIEDMQSSLSPDEEVRLAHQVYNYSKHLELDPLLVISVIRVESDFSAEAVSPMGARGLMQVMPSTARFITEAQGWTWPGEECLFEPSFNIRLATVYLSGLLSKFGSVEDALIAYNCGEGALRQMMSTGEPIPRAFSRRVLTVYSRLKRRYAPAPPPILRSEQIL